MLIIGNLANTYYCNTTITNNVEIIYLTDHENILKEQLNIIDEPIFQNIHCKVYTVNDKKYILYNADTLPALKSLLKMNLAENELLKIASPIVAFIWTKMKTSYIHIDIKEWENYMKAYEYLYDKYIYHSTDLVKHKILTIANSLAVIGALGYNTKYQIKSREVYHTYTKESLYESFTEYPSSLYLKMVSSVHNTYDDILDIKVWDSFLFIDKINAVLEKVYVHASNNYLIEELLFNISFDEDTELIFKKSLMEISSKQTFQWFSNFIKENYSQIIEYIDPLFIDVLYNSIKYENLELI